MSESSGEPLPAPVDLGAFTLLAPVGRGGMGAVYRAVHRPTSADVAVKVIQPGAGEEALAWFRREVQAHARLAHPNVVYLFDYGEADPPGPASAVERGSPFVAMELAERGTVRDAMPFERRPGAAK